jgi:hypothetical protein
MAARVVIIFPLVEIGLLLSKMQNACRKEGRGLAQCRGLASYDKTWCKKKRKLQQRGGRAGLFGEKTTFANPKVLRRRALGWQKSENFLFRTRARQ